LFQLLHLITIFFSDENTFKPVLRCHLWEREKVVF